ncbi:alanyl-tRNA editing protein [Candidatus Woesearchaeota archaeon]|nr:alanyl-tRNA editing protein [Candidatus Woesearchaeota archaeon]
MRALYMDDAYLKEFDAVVKSVKDDKYVVLDNTAFYPNGGGQPFDTGKLVKDGVAYPVDYVGKFDGDISHEVSEPGLQVGDEVRGAIDWDRRYRLMRAHTAAHVVSAVFYHDFNCRITGNQLSEEKIRIDFDLDGFDRGALQSSIDKVNNILAQNLPVTVTYLSREQALQDSSLVKLAGVLPPAVQELRIVAVGGVDRQADGGTHVRNTSEVGPLELLKVENKGKRNRRVYVRLSE